MTRETVRAAAAAVGEEDMASSADVLRSSSASKRSGEAPRGGDVVDSGAGVRYTSGGVGGERDRLARLSGSGYISHAH